MKEKLKVPKLRFKEFSGEWEEKELGKVSEHISYGLTVRPSFVDEGIPLVSAREISTGKVVLKNAPLISISDYNELSDKAKAKKGDIFLSKTGSIGFSAMLEYENEIAITQNIAIIRFKDEVEISSKFILIYFKTSQFLNNIFKKVNQSTIMDLQLQDIRRIEIPFISLPEQQKIADFLSKVDDKIENLTKKKELLEQYKKGLMQKIFSQEIRFKDDNGNDFPEWEEKELGEVALSIRNGISLDQNLEKKGYKVTRIETISKKAIDIEKIGYVNTKKDISEYKLKIGDLLFSNINSVAHIGKIVYVDKDYDLYHGMNLLNIIIDSEKHISKFIFYSLSENRYKKYFESICSKAVNQASINQTELKKTKLSVPSLPEQQKIAYFLSSLDKKIDIVDKELGQVQEFKKGLLQQMFV